MTITKVRAIISLVVVCGLVLTTVILALLPAFFGMPLKEYTEHLKTFAALYSGIVGIILGYYFGQHESKKQSGQSGAGED